MITVMTLISDQIMIYWQVDCSIPRLHDSMMLFGAALRLCQQLKDKVKYTFKEKVAS